MPPKHRLGPRLARRLDVAEYLGIPVEGVDSLLKNGELKKVKIGRRVLIDIEEVDALIEARKKGE